MANLQIKNVPEEMHDELRRRAKLYDMTVRDYVLELIRSDQAFPTKREWMAAVAKRKPVELDRPISELIAEDRAERDREMDRRGSTRIYE